MLFRRGVHRTHLIWRPQVPDQGSTVDFFLFPRLKSIMKGARFGDVAVIQEHMTAVLRSIPKEAFADSFQKLYERCLLTIFTTDYIQKFVKHFNNESYLNVP
jgi:hypothetical protein